MATRKQLLDQNDNDILPITDTESVRNPQGEGTLESRLQNIEENVDANNLFVEQNSLTNAQRIQALANVSNQEAGYESGVFTGKMGYVVLQPETDEKTTFAAQIANKPNTIFEIRDVFDLQDSLVTIPSNSTLKFNGGKIESGTLNLNGCSLEGNVMITSEPAWNEQNEFYEDYKPKNLELKVSWFGAKGDGETDDAPALQRAIKWLHKDGSTLIFDKSKNYVLGDGISDLENDPDKSIHTGYSYDTDNYALKNTWPSGTTDEEKGEYIENHPANIGRDISLYFFHFTNLTILGNNSTIKSHDRNGYCKNNGMICLFCCDNCLLKDLTIDGNRENRPTTGLTGDTNTGGLFFYASTNINNYPSLYSIKNDTITYGEITLTRDVAAGFRYVDNLKVMYCKNCIFDNITSINGLMDGIELNGRDSNCNVVKNSYFARNTRQGVSVTISDNLMIENCKFEYAGLKSNGDYLGIQGATSDIDLECESEGEYYSRNIHVVGCRFLSDATQNVTNGRNIQGVYITRQIQYSTIENCDFVNSSLILQRHNGCYSNVVRYCRFSNSRLRINQEAFTFEKNIVNFEVTGLYYMFGESAHINTYSKDYIYGRDGDTFASITPSKFVDNIISFDYPNGLKEVVADLKDNIVFRGNKFKNLNAPSSSTNFKLYCTVFEDNVFENDTTTYPGLPSDYSLSIRAYPFTQLNNCRIVNPSLPVNFQIEHKADEIVALIRTCRSSTSYRYIIINNVDNAILDVVLSTVGDDFATSPTFKRIYSIRGGNTIAANTRKSIYYQDVYTPNSSIITNDNSNSILNHMVIGGVKSEHSVYRIDTDKIVSSGGKQILCEIHIHTNNRQSYDNIDFVTVLSEAKFGDEYPLPEETFTIDSCNISDIVNSLPSIVSNDMIGRRTFDKETNRLAIWDGLKYIDSDGFPFHKNRGVLEDKPSLSNTDAGFIYYAEDIKKHIYWDGEEYRYLNDNTPVPLDYLTFTSIGETNMSLDKVGEPDSVDLEISKNGGNFSSYTIGDVINLQDEEYIQFRNSNNTAITSLSKSDNDYYQFEITGNGTIRASGNIMSLLDNKVNSITVGNYSFYNLFKDCAKLVSAPKLPATTLGNYCYRGMFWGCGLASAPELPATTLARSCYARMFMSNVSSTFVEAPVLKAESIPSGAYMLMFSGCTKLAKVEIYAKTSDEHGIDNWLSDCNTTVPAEEEYAGVIKCYNSSRSLFPTDSSSGKPLNWGFEDIE